MNKLFRLILVLLALGAFAPAQAQQTFELFRPSSGIMVGNPNSYITSSATSTNVISLWSGTCNATSFLRGDGSCQIVTIAPAGATTQVQFNNAGVFGADDDFTWTAASRTLNVGTTGTGIIEPTSRSDGVGRTLLVRGGTSTLAGSQGGQITVSGAIGGTNSSGGAAALQGGAGNGTSASGGNALVSGGAGGTAGPGGDATVQGGTPTDGNGGSVFLTGSNGVGTNRNGGTVSLTAGTPTGSGTAGSINLLTSGTSRLNILGNGAWQLAGSAGTNGQVITSSGTGGPPTWTTIAGASAANPTAIIGLTTVNGAAATFMRSDAAPALDQSIAPTWSGNHNFTANQNQVSNAAPQWIFNETDAAVDNRVWPIRVSNEQFTIGAMNDAGSTFTSFMAVDRTGTTVDTVALNAGTNNLTVGGSVTSTPGSIRSDKAFATGNLINYGLLSNSTLPSIGFRETDATTNNGTWDIAVEAEQMAFRILNDGALSPATWLNVSRTGVTPQTVGITANNFTFNSNPVVTQNTTTANVSASGCTSNPTAAMRFSIHGNIANVRISLADCTSNATTYSIPVGIPAAYRPTVANQVCAIPVTDNGTRSVGYMTVATGGNIDFFTNSGSFTASGTKGLGGLGNITCTWNIN